jgi:hypothetical protein
LITIEEMNLLYIHHVLSLVGNVRDRAAKILGIDRKTLYRKLIDKSKLSESNNRCLDLNETAQASVSEISHHNGLSQASIGHVKSS